MVISCEVVGELRVVRTLRKGVCRQNDWLCSYLRGQHTHFIAGKVAFLVGYNPGSQLFAPVLVCNSLLERLSLRFVSLVTSLVNIVRQTVNSAYDAQNQDECSGSVRTGIYFRALTSPRRTSPPRLPESGFARSKRQERKPRTRL